MKFHTILAGALAATLSFAGAVTAQAKTEVGFI